jgi:Domain of unknown function (DUF4189)
MRRIALFATGLVALTGVLANAGPAFAQHASIAYDKTNCGWGRSWNYDTQVGANNRAMSECNSQNSHCQVVVEIGPEQCGALAATDDCGGYGWATRPSLNAAKAVAMQQCYQYNPGSNCTLQASVCSEQ